MHETLLTRIFGYLTVIMLGALTLALLTDTTTGDFSYSISDAFFGWVIVSMFLQF